MSNHVLAILRSIRARPAALGAVLGPALAALRLHGAAAGAAAPATPLKVYVSVDMEGVAGVGR